MIVTLMGRPANKETATTAIEDDGIEEKDQLTLIRNGDEKAALKEETVVTYLAQWNDCHCTTERLYEILLLTAGDVLSEQSAVHLRQHPVVTVLRKNGGSPGIPLPSRARSLSEFGMR